jgi:hypothetical protein
MTTWFGEGARFRGLCRILTAVGLVAIAASTIPAAAAEVLSVRMDQATLARLPQNVATLVVGNPLIADVSIQPGGLMIVTGKGYGVTNLIALDRNGAVLMDKDIQVKGPQDIVVVYRGVERESYSCAPKCDRRITLGDSPDFFDATLGQTGTLSGRAQGNAAQSGNQAR